MDAQTSFSWDKVSASATFYVDSEARAVINAYVSQTFGHNFRQVLAKPSVGFFVGPIPVDVNAEIAIGCDVNFTGSGKFRVGGGFNSKLGLTAGVEAGVEWDWFNTRLYSRGYANKIDTFASQMIGPELEMSGTATVEPYFEVRPGLRVAKIVGVSVGLRGYINGQATVTSTTDTNITANFLIKAGVKGVNPSLDIGLDIFGFYIGKNFPLASTLFDVYTTLFDGQLVQARPVNPATFAPKFSVAGGIYNDELDIALTSDTIGAEIRYTLNGDIPTATSGTVYATPIHISNDATIKAIAYKSGMSPSLVNTQAYDLRAATPVFSVASGTNNPASFTVSFGAVPAGTQIYYTKTEGSGEPGTPSDPTTSSTLYTGTPISITHGVTRIKAKAFRTPWDESPVVPVIYTIAMETIKRIAFGFAMNPSQSNTGMNGSIFSLSLNGLVVNSQPYSTYIGVYLSGSNTSFDVSYGYGTVFTLSGGGGTGTLSSGIDFYNEEDSLINHIDLGGSVDDILYSGPGDSKYARIYFDGHILTWAYAP